MTMRHAEREVAPEPDPGSPSAATADRPVRSPRPDPDTGRPGRGRVRWVLVPLAIFTVTRFFQLVLVDWMSTPGSAVRDRLLIWDAVWFVRVARDGYPTSYVHTDQEVSAGAELAFFPGYPALIRLVREVTRLDFDSAAIVAAWIAAAAAAVLIYALAAALWGDRVATILTMLALTQPMSAVLSMAYSEALFIAFAAGCLLAAYRQRWLLAGLLCLGAGLTRATGAALAIALLVAAVLHVLDRDNGPRRWLALLYTAIGAAGVPGYIAWVGWRVGDRDAWFTIQSVGWGTKFDFGKGMAQYVYETLRAGDGWVRVSVAWLLLAAVGAAVVALRCRIWPPLVVYGLVGLATVLGRPEWYHVKPRLLVPVLLTLVPAALALGRARPRTAAAVIVGFAFFGMWYGAYLITVWPYAI
jgi:hypothetical protein